MSVWNLSQLEGGEIKRFVRSGDPRRDHRSGPPLRLGAWISVWHRDGRSGGHLGLGIAINFSGLKTEVGSRDWKMEIDPVRE